MANPLSRRPAAWIVAASAAMAAAITVLLSKAVTLASPLGAALPPSRRRSSANRPAPGPTG